VSLITFLFFTLLLINVYLCMCGVNVKNVVRCLKCVMNIGEVIARSVCPGRNRKILRS